MSTEQFVAALTEYRLDPTEIAEILWLALRQPVPEADSKSDVDSKDDGMDQEEGANDDVGIQGNGTDPDPGDQENETDTDEESEDNDDDASFDLAPELSSGTLPQKALPISVPDAGILNDTLPLVRAMKPLLKQLESQMMSTVNEAETVDRIAETNIWSPVLDPDQEPWFEVALVIDRSPAMNIWQRLIQDIQRFLRCYGSFRDFRVWQLAVVNGEVGLCALPDAESGMRSPRSLLAPDARRLILVFSDCTADYWWDGSLQPILSLWGKSTPTAVWQVLPDWMWKRTALGIGEYVAVRNHIPGAKNTKLTPVSLSLRSAARRGRQQADSSTLLPTPICIPVVTSEGKSLGAWSQMLAGDRRYSTPGFILPPTGWLPSAASESESEDLDAEDKADELLEDFRIRATPSARRLAALLSAAPVITLPVMRLIRASDELLPGSSPLPVAEVFLGGLLKKAPAQSDVANPELVQYTFPDEVRDDLLDILPKVDAIEVIEAVSKYVAEQLNCTLADFRALLLSPDLKAEADQYGLRSFAKMTARILRKVGPEFAELVDALDAPTVPAQTPPEPNIEIPPLYEITFRTARVIDTAQERETVDWPELVVDDFTIATLEQVDEEEDEGLEPFEFTIATVERQDNKWQIRRKAGQGRHYLEQLPNDVLLDMVAIPRGIFLMGSSRNELLRNSDERQHEVMVTAFFIGRYPVTQEQYEAVMETNPAQEYDAKRFVAPNKPVVGVSWRSAMNFCRRLSELTGREYSLPSEAQWEYACRAGTETPFHFGETIHPELANYYSDNSYNRSPTAQPERKTTPVNQFDMTNEWGLCDMHGNVWEWCLDHYGLYNKALKDSTARVTKNDLANRILRGGSWEAEPRICRSAYRDYYSPDARDSDIGFRVMCRAPRILP